jgi:hypothetical protein
MIIRKPIKLQSLLDNVEGYSTLVGVLLIGAVGSFVVVSYLLLGIGSLQTGFAEQQSALARHLADACAEEGMIRVSLDLAYTGGDALSFSEGTCNISAVTGAGNSNRVVQAFGTVGTVVRRVEVTISSVQPQVTVTEWEEVDAF